MGGRGATGGTTSASGGGGGSSTRGGSGAYKIPQFTAASLNKMSRSQLVDLYNKVAVNETIKIAQKYEKRTMSRSEAQARVNSLGGGTSSTAQMKKFIKKYGK